MELDVYEIMWDKYHEMPWRVVYGRPSRPNERFILCRCFTRNDAVRIKDALERVC